MMVDFQKDDNKKNNNMMIYLKFLDVKGEEIKYDQINSSNVSLLRNEINDYVNELTNQLEEKPPIVSRDSIKKIGLFLKNLKNFNIENIKKTLNFYQELHSINIFTCYRYKDNEEIIGRTTIELDADILTIIPAWLIRHEKVHLLCDLHMVNVFLSNYLFFYPITKLFARVRLLKEGIGWILASIWMGSSYMSLDSIPHMDIVNSLYFTLDYMGIPILIIQTLPRIIGYFLKRFLSKKHF
jgi:hypothetical protein